MTDPNLSPEEVESLFFDLPMGKIMSRDAELCPSSLYEYVVSQRSTSAKSSAVSTVSTDSVDSANTSISVSTVGEETEEQRSNRLLLDKLFSSLFKTARSKLSGIEPRKNSRVPVDEKTEKNMSRVKDWMPLLHLFDPKTFYASKQTNFSELPPELQIASNPREATKMLNTELNIEKLTGGNSNHVYRLAHPLFESRPILLRVYGSGDDEAIDRFRDIQAMKQMSEAELSPAVLHTFKWGRVEEFMDEVATSTTDMLLSSPTLLSDIFKVLRKMHRLPFEPFLPENVNRKRFNLFASPEGSSSKDPNAYYNTFANMVKANLRSTGKYHSYYDENMDEKVMEILCPTSLERVSLRYLRLASANFKPQYRDSIVQYYTQKLMEVRSYFQRHNIPLVFSHNDLNPGNVLLSWRLVPKTYRDPTHMDASSDMISDTMEASEQSSVIQRKYKTKFGAPVNLVDAKGVIFIDFEYSDANYRGFDLGNVLCELDVDYMKGNGEGEPGYIKYLYCNPLPEFKEAWKDLPEEYPRLPTAIHAAWKRRCEAEEEDEDSNLHSIRQDEPFTIADIALRAIETYFAADDSRQGRKLTKDQLAEVFLGMLASHFYWSLWSFVLACNQDDCTNNIVGEEGEETFAKGSSGLDYMYYGRMRLKEFIALQKWMKEKEFI
ncbi:choline/ethanolamine kinase [Angomonas deanei]|uniref:Phosphotransferase enzyme family/Choline/ethanolamine kinase, putative n=1 Tax=Angomonas deanei TaxID=59799 RepID=S9VYW3_9TRYP|nr:choline/ethanolamine kinase [Angomonas deanei]EPY39803.1 choline/ethanolamine kinase [Angomonas deanei]CAD2214500.1 Phosphotransferase enzyme family/Choline/ethanolamine kinase, putative [Angomonas deanei]|eukprot:EPY28885.1 choline/ethanolamine kinase [Angomonas deanei]